MARVLKPAPIALYFPGSVTCPGGHVQESAHAFSFLGGLFGVRHTARDFLGFTAFESAVQTSGKEGVGVASDAYKRAVVEFTAVGPSPVCPWGTSVNRNPKKTSAVWRTPKSPPPPKPPETESMSVSDSR